MRKFTLILASMFLTLGTWAQTVVTTINTERAYTLECRSGYAHSTARFIGVTDEGVINGQASTAAYITFENGTEDGSYYIKVGEKYINCDGNNLSASTEKTTAWVLGTVDQTVTFKYPNTAMYLNNNGTTCIDGTITNLKANNHPSGPNAGNACSTWKMCEYDLNNSVEVTYNYMFNGVQKKSATVTQMVGDAYEAPAIDYVTLAYPDGSVTKETTTVQVTCTQNLPFTVSTDYANATWYYMTIRSNNQEYVARSENAPYTNSQTIIAGDDGLWAFKGNVFDGIQVINKGAGDGYTLGCAGTTTGANVSMAKGENTWTIEEGNGGFILGQGENAYAHDYHDDKLQIWNDAAAATDAGSAFNVFSAEELTNTQKTALQTLIDQARTYEAGTTVGYYTEASVANLVTPLANANTALSSNSLEVVLNATTALQDAINNLELILPEKGKFYTFKNDSYYITCNTIETGNKNIALSEEKGDEVIYYFDGTHLLAYKTGLYIGLNGTDWGFEAVGSNDISTIEFVAAANGKVAKYNISSGGRWLHRTEAYVNRCSNNTCGDAHNWTIEEVETLPVTIGSTGYATFNAPVALTIPANVEAYTGSLNGNWLTLNKVETTILPAETPVILKGEANTYDFVVTEGGEAIGDNALSGTIAKVAATTATNPYTLQSHDGGVAFKKFKSADPSANLTLTGFKAYLDLKDNTESNAIGIRFEDGTTGIDHSELTIQNSELIFDLMGRRVETMIEGNIYIVNGKKVIR